jgi:hypothetical protein
MTFFIASRYFCFLVVMNNIVRSDNTKAAKTKTINVNLVIVNFFEWICLALH